MVYTTYAREKNTKGGGRMDGYLSIGGLSKMAGVSVDTIRYYADIGLFEPAYISDETGYRYYLAEQAAAIGQIRELKSFGFTLAEIKALPLHDEAYLAGAYRTRYSLLMQEMEKLQDTMESLQKKLYQKEMQKMENTNIHAQTEITQETKALEDIKAQLDKSTPPRVLLVDDAAFMRMMCKDMLTKAGYVIAGEAENGLQAFEMYKSLKPDFVLLDIAMPGHDGIWALEKIMEHDPAAKVAMLSAMGQASNVLASFSHGAMEFVVKPFQAERLVVAAHRMARSGFDPLDKDALRKMTQNAAATSDRILSQQEIDTIKETAQAGRILDSGAINALVHAVNPVQDETVTLLHRLVEGQNKMTAVLERLVDKVNKTE